jgi:flagellar basal body-associated protein FliL
MMSWIRSSERTVALALLGVLLLGAVGTAAALTITASDVPEESQVGNEVQSRFTIDDAFTENSQYTLRLETELENVSWTVEKYDQGSRVEQWQGGGQEFEQQVSSDPTGDQIRIQVVGDAPDIDELNYSNPENFTVVAIRSQTGDNVQTLKTYEVHHFTEQSKNAREAIDGAQQSIEEAGGSNEEAQRSLEQAISAYENGNFENAVSNAEDAQSAAEQQQQSQQTTQMLLFAGLGVLVLALVVGGVWYYRNQQDDYDKLR